jgi:hypothetical protein
MYSGFSIHGFDQSQIFRKYFMYVYEKRIMKSIKNYPKSGEKR